jgi:ABC-2 type transport system ATP-binding protein
MPNEKNETPAIFIENVTKSYRVGSGLTSKLALDQVNFSVKRGEVFGFLGPNGAGKTSLIKILVGILRTDRGECRIMGHDSGTREAKLKLGYLPERPYFHDFLTAGEFLKFHGRLVGLSDKEIEKNIPALLKKVGLSKSREQRLRTFSKGMLQRIGFAQALLHDPDILILDEPMSGLDPVGRREVRDIISEVASQGKTIFFSTHIVHDVEVICTTVGFINGGKLKGAGNIEVLLGKTIKSMEIRFELPTEKVPHKFEKLKNSRRTMDGWVIELESLPDRLESDVSDILTLILSERGRVRAVVPRKSTLEDLFFEVRS